MSFWPRLRRRSRGRKRSSAKPNPYANIGLEKLAVVHAEFDAQRALFAAEKGVPVSVVRFVSGSPHGWTLLPRSAVSPSPEEEEDNRSSVTSTASSSPGRGSVEVPASPRHPHQRTSSIESVSEKTPGRPGIPDSSGIEAPSSSSPLITVNAGRSNLTKLQSSSAESQVVVVSDKDQEWNKLTKSSSVLLVSLGLFSTAVGFNTIFAFIVGGWNRGKSSFKRVFSHLAIHLLSAVRSSLQLQEQPSSSASGTSISSSAEEAEMKVARPTPISSVTVKEAGAESPQSSFTFPVLSRDSSVGTPIFRVQQDVPSSQGQGGGASPALGPVVTSVKVVAVSSQPGSPAFDGSKGSQKPCNKLKARIFKCHPPRKVTPATSENSSSAEEDAADGEAEVEPPIEGSGTDSPPRSVESPRCKRLSFMKRRSKSSKKGPEADDQLSGQSTTESELEDVSTPVTRVVTVKAAKSSEVLASRNPNSDSAPEAAKKLSRSQELKLSFKKLKRRYKSQEISPAGANHQEFQQLALESATVKGLDELAFPFNHETDSNCSTATTPGPKADKKKSCLIKMLSPDSDKSGEGSVPSPRSTSTSSSRLCKSMTSPVSRMATDKNTNNIDYRPELRKVKTVSPRVPLLADNGELARSAVLDRETLGALLVLAVLGFLLLGKIPAILGTACLCLILSHIQRFMSNNMTPAQRERLASSRNVGVVGLSRLGGTSPPHSHGQGSPPIDLQSSEYRKKVLIEGFLDRGNRKTA